LIYSDENMKIEVKILQFQKGFLPVILTFLSNPEDIKPALLKTCEGIKPLMSLKMPTDSNTHPQLMMKINLNDSFNNPLLMGFAATVNQNNVKCSFALPILITKFLVPTEISFESYNTLLFEYNNATEDEYHRFDSIMYNPIDGKGTIMDFLKKLGSLLHNLNFRVYPPSDSNNFHEIDAISILNTSETNKIFVLAQASFVPSFSPEFRFSLRAKSQDSHSFSNICLDIYSIVKFYVNPY